MEKTETKNEDRAEIEGDESPQELDEILDRLADETITDNVKVKNGTLKLDSVGKLMSFERVVNYGNTVELDHAEIKLDTIEISDIVMLSESDHVDQLKIFINRDEEEHHKALTYWPERQHLDSEDWTIRVGLSEDEAEELEIWIREKLED